MKIILSDSASCLLPSSLTDACVENVKLIYMHNILPYLHMHTYRQTHKGI